MCVRIRGHLSVCARGCVRSCCVFCAVVRHLRVSWFCPSAPYNACVACSKEGVVRPRASQLRVRHDEGGGGDHDGVPDHLGLRARPSREKRPRHWVETRRERVDYPMLLRDEGEEDGERDAGGERGREVEAGGAGAAHRHCVPLRSGNGGEGSALQEADGLCLRARCRR